MTIETAGNDPETATLPVRIQAPPTGAFPSLVDRELFVQRIADRADLHAHEY